VSRLVVIGDALLDRDLDGRAERLAPDAPVPVVDAIEAHPRPGGAGLAACLAAADGHDVTLVCALGDDAAGRELQALLHDAGVTVIDLGLRGATPEKVRVRVGGRALVRLDHGGEAAGCGPLAALPGADAVLVSDYGRGVASLQPLRRALRARADGTPLVWDPHPRGAEPVPAATVVTPSHAEAVAFDGRRPAADADRATRLARRWLAEHVCITRGERGAVVGRADGEAWAVPAQPVAGDPCGAGDRFAARLATALAGGADVADAVRNAVRCASEFVAADGARQLEPPRAAPDAAEVARRVRAAGGRLVATGGCFDLLHAGHLQLLESARGLGDALVVLINDDESVTRLKGPSRPLVTATERAALLAALRCVDAVLVFSEDDPCAALERLRPDVWVKGGDYRLGELPEAAIVERWGGEVALLPYLEDRSTTRLLKEASLRAVH
jgi:rfaE bifunctional protein nucleotidyltransferase chain/domain/rfaE bifunctional protein kinase chain/domain